MRESRSAADGLSDRIESNESENVECIVAVIGQCERMNDGVDMYDY